jgi:DNA repair protein RecO (recombination protein O)
MTPRATVDRALLLRRIPYGESSLVVHALTREHGVVHLLARGAYRPTARYYAALDLFDTLEIEWAPTPGRELALLRAARIAVRRHRIARELARFAAGTAVLEIAALGAREGPSSPELHDLAAAALDDLAAGRTADLALLEFELAFLRALGLAPALDRCAACGGPPGEPVADGGEPRAEFSAGAGGRLCPSCAREARASGRRVGTLPTRVLELAHELLRGELAGAREPRPDEVERTRDFVARFVEYHLEARPKSYAEFLALENRNRPCART